MSGSLRSRLDRIEGQVAVMDPHLLDRLAGYRADPVGFNRDVLGRTLWSKQEEVCGAVASSPVTVVPAGRAVGKSFLLAGLALWWLYTRRGSRVIVTGPDHRQVVSVCWSEMAKALRQAPVRLPYAQLTEGYGSPQRLAVDALSRWECLGYAAKTTEGFSGQHAGEMLVIVDEASGIEPNIWAAIHGLAANRLVVAGNPVRFDSRFRELHDLACGGSPQVKTVPISSLESPDAAKEHSPVGMADRVFLRFMREVHGEGSPWWRSNILGLFPGEESARFIPLAWIDACTDEAILSDELWQEISPGPTRIAVDIGGGVGADRSVVLVRDDRQLLELWASGEHGVLDDSGHRLEPVVVDLAHKWGVRGPDVIYDRGGIGRSFGSYLANHGLDGAVGYFGAGRGGPYYANRRAANCFAIKRRLDPNRKEYVGFYCGGIGEWPMLRQELAELRDAPMEVVEGRVKQSIEGKAELSARLHRSSDLLDALIMSFTFIVN